MGPSNISLNTKLTLDLKLGHKTFETVELGQILYELKVAFPNGFFGRQATEFLQTAFGGVPTEFRNRSAEPAGTLYKALSQMGYLKMVDKKSKKEKVRYSDSDLFGGGRRGTHTRTIPFYMVRENALDGYQPPKKEDFAELSLPKGLVMLLEDRFGLVNSNRLTRNHEIRVILENILLEDGPFLRHKSYLQYMQEVKERLPEYYDSHGGVYLDKLIQTRGIKK